MRYKNALEIWEKDENQDMSLKSTLSAGNEEGKTDFFTGKLVGNGLLFTTSEASMSYSYVLWDLIASKKLNKWTFSNSCVFTSDRKCEKFLLHTIPSADKQIFDIWYAYQHQDSQEKLKALNATLEDMPLEVILYVFLYTQIPSSLVSIDEPSSSLTQDQRVKMGEIRTAHKQMNNALHVKTEGGLKKVQECAAEVCAKYICDSRKREYRPEKLLKLVEEFGCTKSVIAVPIEANFPAYGTLKLPLIFHAAAFGNVETCEKLVKMGASPTAIVEGITPYHCALVRNNKDVINFFSGNQSALTAAIDRNDRDLVRLLLKQNDMVVVPFHIKKALYNQLTFFPDCYFEMVVILLNHAIEQGNLAQILTQNELGNFGKYGIKALPLTHHACAAGLPAAEQLLGALGADRNKKVDGISSLDCFNQCRIDRFLWFATLSDGQELRAAALKIESCGPYWAIIETIKRLKLQALIKHLKIS